MPLNAIGWTSEEDEILVDLVEPNPFLYNILDPSRRNILARESKWQEIGEALGKPVEECKKRWKGLRDGYMRNKRSGTVHKAKAGIFEKLQFLDAVEQQGETPEEQVTEEQQIEMDCQQITQEENRLTAAEQVITDDQEYFEITVVGETQEEAKPFIKIVPKLDHSSEVNKVKRKPGRKRAVPIPRSEGPPIKILPKPIIVNGPKLVRLIEDPKTPEQRSQNLDKLIEKVLKENTNEIDVFFKSMAASVKKLHPNLIPKVKMEVCNVIAKYEMQSFSKNVNNP
ncbi:Transcription factor Adf-1 [Eumeta japonica]|uniref:Transcription factor Adf-1 n=1 Tax=Eumeta variegata TaxID=151549 RepID=A0A4C1SEZ3_EUMVA|nr:Transcription factor Adf-1 [Eumeta japonica]